MAGRPSEYDHTYHPETLLELMSQGMTNIEVCSELEISEKTLIRWRKAYTEFNEAYEKGLAKCETNLIIRPLKKMVQEGNEKGYRALAHLARNKFDHDKQTPQSVTQVNIGQISVNSREEYDKLALETKDLLLDLNIVDAEYIHLEPNKLENKND